MMSPARPHALARARRAFGRVSQKRRLIGLGVIALLGGAACLAWPATYRLAAVGTLILVVAALVLRAPAIICLTVLIGAIAVVVPLFSDAQVTVSGAVLLIAVGLANIVQAVRRERLGLGQISAESVIGLLRGRLRVQGEVPPVPSGWAVDVQQRAADGAAMAGDFVSTRVTSTDAGPVLDLAVVDVSGSGIEAGSRALLLSGAVGGLLGAVPPENLLPEVNAYLMRQRWAAGFATCAYVRAYLDSGVFEVRAAGHPPPLLRRGDGQWSECHSAGTLLGVVDTLTCAPYVSRLRPGDALVVVTDGVIEDRVEPLEAGVARLQAAADSHLSRQLPPAAVGAVGGPLDVADGLASALVDTVPTRRDDDRAVVVIRRPARSEPVRSEPARDDAEAPPRRGVAG